MCVCEMGSCVALLALLLLVVGRTAAATCPSGGELNVRSYASFT